MSLPSSPVNTISLALQSFLASSLSAKQSTNCFVWVSAWIHEVSDSNCSGQQTYHNHCFDLVSFNLIVSGYTIFALCSYLPLFFFVSLAPMSAEDNLT